MKLYSYIVRHDTGFAPNPFYGYCTLACCKPIIRRTAEKGDWVVGLTPKSAGNEIAYFMRVDDVVQSFSDYWSDPRFGVKKPSQTGELRKRCGDNIYEPRARGYPQDWLPACTNPASVPNRPLRVRVARFCKSQNNRNGTFLPQSQADRRTFNSGVRHIRFPRFTGNLRRRAS